MKSLWYLLAIILASISALAQTETRPRTTKKEEPPTIYWRKTGCDVCLFHLDKGSAYEIINEQDMLMMVTLTDTGDRFEFDVAVHNKSEKVLHVVPAEFVVGVVEPQPKPLKQIPPQQITKAIRNKAKWLNVFTGFGGAATQTVRANTETQGEVAIQDNRGNSARGTYSDQSQTTVTVPDYEARRRANEKIEQRKRESENKVAAVEANALLSQTLAKNENVMGTLYFERDKKAKVVAIGVVLNGKVYVFPFTLP